MIDQLRKLSPVKVLCRAFGILRSSYYHYRATRKSRSSDRTKLNAMIHSLFKQSRCLMCAEKTGGFNLVNYRHSSGVYHEQETEDLHRRI